MQLVPLPGEVSVAIVRGSRLAGRHLHADPPALLTLVLQCCLCVGWVAGRQDERCREEVFLTVPRKWGVLTAPNTHAHNVSQVLPVSCFQRQVSRVGACCCCAVAVMTASLQALTAEAAQKWGMFLLAFLCFSSSAEKPLRLGSGFVFPVFPSFSLLFFFFVPSPFTTLKSKVKQNPLIF